jgi:hypothetical protein
VFDFNLADVKINGVSVGTANGVYNAPLGAIEVVATDQIGNQTRLVRDGSVQPPTPNCEEQIQQLLQRIAELEAENAAQKAKLEEFWNWLANHPQP